MVKINVDKILTLARIYLDSITEDRGKLAEFGRETGLTADNLTKIKNGAKPKPENLTKLLLGLLKRREEIELLLNLKKIDGKYMTFRQYIKIMLGVEMEHAEMVLKLLEILQTKEFFSENQINLIKNPIDLLHGTIPKSQGNEESK